MLYHYITIFFRNLKRQKLYATFNIIGLSIGLTTFILIALLVQYENNFDKFHNKLDRIYRIEEIAHMTDGDQLWSQTCYPIAENFKTEFPEIEDAVVTRPVWGDYLSSSENSHFSNLMDYMPPMPCSTFLLLSLLKAIWHLPLLSPHQLSLLKN